MGRPGEVFIPSLVCLRCVLRLPIPSFLPFEHAALPKLPQFLSWPSHDSQGCKVVVMPAVCVPHIATKLHAFASCMHVFRCISFGTKGSRHNWASGVCSVNLYDWVALWNFSISRQLVPSHVYRELQPNYACEPQYILSATTLLCTPIPAKKPELHSPAPKSNPGSEPHISPSPYLL